MNDSSQNFPWFNVDGEVASLMARLDWSANAIGPPATWSQQLNTVVGLVLQSRSPAAVVWGHELSTLYNDAYAVQLGDKHPASLGTSFSAIWSEIWPEIEPVIDAAMAGKSLYFEDIPYMVEPTGVPTQRWYTSSFSPVKDSSCTVVGVYITAVETTKRMQVERRYAFQADLTERVRHLNSSDDIVAAASELLGRHLGIGGVAYAAVDESEEILTMKPDWASGGSQSLAGAVLRLDDFGPLVGDAVRAGKDLAIADITTDERSAAHAAAYAERSIRSFVSIPLLKDGRLRAILNLHDSAPHYWTTHEIALAKDMVDRTWSAVENSRAQSELRRERDQSRHVFDNMTEGFGLVDKDWTVVYMNPAGLRITRRAAEEVIGRNHWQVWPELAGTVVGDLFEQVIRTRKPGVVEAPHTMPDMERRWIESRVYPSLDGGLAFFFRDITERKAAQEKLEAADRRKDEFLAMLAHELRNPLAPISAAAQLLQVVKLDEERVRQTSQVIGRQVQHMTSLVDDLLDVSRVTRGLIELDNEPLDIRNIVSDAVEQVTPLIRSRRHHFALHLPPETTMVAGDKKRLVQVVTNILNNAAKYTQEGGNIVLKVEVHAGHVVIDVTDNGIGMSRELADRAFDLFAQAERSSDRSSGGLGLGLALVRSLVDLHRGKVTCESAGLGKGSRFTVCLPRLPQEHGRTGHGNSDTATKQAGHSLRILVVDDNVDAASLLAMLLEIAGHDVQVEHGAHRALDLARKTAPQVCLLDIGLPEMDGNELAQHLRAQPETARSVLIAVTGYGQDQDRRQTRAAGFDHHLVKPVDIEKLMSLLSEVGEHR
ncbi:hybrid sensor histidine kinase/response regulator [Pseudoduganella umbonata]|uniref:histidine kinase n=2 Tax=Pseudoduganella umbonata TaxID=864828 RepID=A0A4P8HZ26_9BURK|nr:ATP-binding protein [Pseudoduganella umbonata]MBB3221898.1 PAS domain S-box-containing protein [Pseudoduganella umbonata]QCP14302.1 response regulator [Pseudoduganella umbonata]